MELENKELVNFDTQLEKLQNLVLKEKKDVFAFFSRVNEILKNGNLYVDVKEAVNEILLLIDSYKEFDKVGEFSTDVNLYVQEDEPIKKFNMTFTNSDGIDVTKTGDVVLQCDVKYNETSFTIKPSIMFVFYEENDSESLSEANENDTDDIVKIKSLEPSTDEDMEFEFGDFDDEEPGSEDEEDSEEEEEYLPDLANDEVVQEVLRNIIISKIYAEGYEYPNDDKLDEMTEKLLHMMNDFLEENLEKAAFESEEEEEEEEEEGTKTSKNNIDYDNKSSIKLKNDNYLEIHEKKTERPDMLFVFRVRVVLTSNYEVKEISHVVEAKTQKQAEKILKQDLMKIYGIEVPYQIIDVLPIERKDLMNE
ncbi:MAG: hypothetical protein N3A54_00480 [Patescibacteria group bacterium]|nr:hypothetical protein [Patescibacteria group bacterium]